MKKHYQISAMMEPHHCDEQHNKDLYFKSKLLAMPSLIYWFKYIGGGTFAQETLQKLWYLFFHNSPTKLFFSCSQSEIVNNTVHVELFHMNNTIHRYSL